LTQKKEHRMMSECAKNEKRATTSQTSADETLRHPRHRKATLDILDILQTVV
uniref:NR2C1 n=1 Tax=Toxocara canis TaxID=6265 RepID=A0A183VA30_TOXCA